MDRDRIEWLKSLKSFPYFTYTYGTLYDAGARAWISFSRWPLQEKLADELPLHKLVVVLKARQLGVTYLCLIYALWLMIFRPAAEILLFSLRDNEAMELLSRLKKMYENLPAFMRCRAIVKSNEHEFTLSNGSRAQAFPSGAGDSYSGNLAIVDEADLLHDLGKLLRSVKPVVDADGQLIMVSRSDKSKPQSEFKSTYRAAVAGGDWFPAFLPWYTRPSRTKKWYEAQKAEIESRTGTLDDLFEQYPATDTEALAARTLDKRYPPQWLEQCYEEPRPETDAHLPDIGSIPDIPGLVVYRHPVRGREYVIGGDPAEGNPTSDDSAATVLDAWTGEEVAKLKGKFQPAIFAMYIDILAVAYNNAEVLVERNNHGHAVLLWLSEHSECSVMSGFDDKPGWLSSTKGKALMYSVGGDVFRDRKTTIHSKDSLSQLQSIEGNTLRAPEGLPDDLADSYVLALVAIYGPVTSNKIEVGENFLSDWR